MIASQQSARIGGDRITLNQAIDLGVYRSGHQLMCVFGTELPRVQASVGSRLTHQAPNVGFPVHLQDEVKILDDHGHLIASAKICGLDGDNCRIATC